MGNDTQSNVLLGRLVQTSAADLTGYEGRLVVPGSAGVNLPAAVSDLAILLLVEVVTTAQVVCDPIYPDRQIRVRLKGTCTKGDELVLAAIAGTDAGKVRAKPATPGRYFRVGIAEEDGVEGQLVLIRPHMEMVDVGGDLGPLAADPSSPVEGDRWVNTTTHLYKWFDGTAVRTLAYAGLLLLMFAVLALLAPAAGAADVTPAKAVSATGFASVASGDNVKVPTGATFETVGNATIGGTLGVTGAATFTGGIANTGTVTTANIDGGTIDGTVIGGATPAAAAVTDLTVSGTLTGSSFIGRVSKTFSVGDMTDNTDATGYIDFTEQLPAGSVVLGWKCVTATGFSGDTTATVQVGKAGAVGAYSTVTSGSCLTAVTVGSASVLAMSFEAAAVAPRVTITGGADFTSITAGTATVTVFYAY